MNIKYIIGVLFLTACAPHPPDVYVFEALNQRLSRDSITDHLILTPSPTCMKKLGEPECGHGVAIMSGKEIFVGESPAGLYNGKPWSVLKSESVYLPAVESYAPLANYIIDACKKMNCNDQVDAFRIKLNGLNGVSGAINHH